MITVKNPGNYKDEYGNKIKCERGVGKSVVVNFRGSNNTLIIDSGARLGDLKIMFDCNGGTCEIGKNKFKGKIRIGEKCSVIINDGVTCTGKCYISTAEHCSVTIGRDCMIASRNEIRADDGHPIFSVETGKRLNMPRSIVIGDHVWLGAGAAVLGGSKIGSGSVIGLGSVVKGKIPNNCIAVGGPAKVVRRHCVWERPHLTLKKPYYKPDAGAVEKSDYWDLTHDGEATISHQTSMKHKGGLRWFLNKIHVLR